VLALMCVAWLALRFLVKSALAKQGSDAPDNWLTGAWRLLDVRYSLDRVVVWFLLAGFVLLALYGALSGVTQELLALGSGFGGWNLARFAHQEALGVGSWILLGLLTLLLLANSWERRRGVYLLGALISLSTVILLLAGQFENQIATATAWRWLAAAFLLGGSVLFWCRRAISQRLARFGWPTIVGDAEGVLRHARTLLIAVTVLPIVALTANAALRAIGHHPVQSPISGFFSLLGDDLSYGVPLLVVALVMIGYALRERLPEYAFYAGAFINATVLLAFVLAVVTSGGSLDQAMQARMVQLNALTCAGYMLPWLSIQRHWRSALDDSNRRFAGFLFKLQLWIAITLTIGLFLPSLGNLIGWPQFIESGTHMTGSLLGWLALFSIVLAAVWLAVSGVIRLSANALAAFLLGLCCLVAFGAAGISGWVGLYSLTVCVTLAAFLMLAAAEIRTETASLIRRVFDLNKSWQPTARFLAACFGGFAVYLSLRTLEDSEISHWWSIGPLLAICVLAAILNWKTQRRRYLYAAGLLFNLCVGLWCVFVAYPALSVAQFLFVNLIGMSLAGVVWLWLELRARQRSSRPLQTNYSVHHWSAIASLLLLAWLVIGSFFADGFESPVLDYPGLTWSAFVSVLVLLVACLWDRYAKYAVAGLYALGLLACAIVLQQLELAPQHFVWSATILLAGYTIITASLWHGRARLIKLAQSVCIPERITAEVTELKWLSGVTMIAVAAVAALAYWINISFLDFGLRATAALVVVVQLLTFGLLAEGDRERHWRRTALAVFVVGAIFLGWSWLTPGVDATWLNRSVILMLETFGLTALYALVLKDANSRWPQWSNSARACVPWLLGAGAVALFFCLGTEVSYQINFGVVLINPLSLIAIGLTLVAAVVICVLFALTADHDPLSLSERARMNYVYVAEVLLALLFLHVRLTMPWLFTGFIERYWPLVVMVIAYLGITASEALRRRNLLVVSQPLERTGVFMPLLPVLGFWLASSEVDFSLLLFVVGGLYGLLSILRRSFVFGLLAAIAGNGGLWYILQRTDDYQFLQHPQLWLIPVALSVLLAAYLNEDRFTDDQMTAVRYLSLVTIYASSTADIFINGVANSPWLPLILGSFSLAGVFAGITLRIRGLLLLGSVFLLLSITTMIWYASANFGWTWLWYVAGIVTGATIIFMFAVFEKKRSDVLRVVDGLREWER